MNEQQLYDIKKIDPALFAEIKDSEKSCLPLNDTWNYSIANEESF